MNTEDTAAAEVALTRIYQQADPDHPAIRLPETAPYEHERYIPDGIACKVVVVGRLKTWRPCDNQPHLRATICNLHVNENHPRIEILTSLSAHEWCTTIEGCHRIALAALGAKRRERFCPVCGKRYMIAGAFRHHVFATWDNGGCAWQWAIALGDAQPLPRIAQRGLDPRAIR